MAARGLLFALDSDQGGKNYIFDASFIKMSQKARCIYFYYWAEFEFIWTSIHLASQISPQHQRSSWWVLARMTNPIGVVPQKR